MALCQLLWCGIGIFSDATFLFSNNKAEFNVFDATKSRTNMNQGNFFSSWKVDAQGYGGNVRAFFLNIKNSADSGTGYKALNKFKGAKQGGSKSAKFTYARGI